MDVPVLVVANVREHKEKKNKKIITQQQAEVAGRKDKLYFPSGRFGSPSVPIPEVGEEFTEHSVKFQK